VIQKDFAIKAAALVQDDPLVIGLAVAGSWVDDQLDEYSDLDLVLVTQEKVGGDKEKMIAFARSLGDFISGFTGEHVGEPRLLICLYNNPLLHVDIKFVTLKEFETRVENPVVLFEVENKLTKLIKSTKPHWPETDFQWIEDRFWTWVHYACLKIGRGELMEAFDFLSFLRQTVLSPLLQVKNNKQARGVRKVEKELSPADLENLKITIAKYNRESIIKALDNCISIYKTLRRKLYKADVHIQADAEKQVLAYFRTIKKTQAYRLLFSYISFVHASALV
jgi:hypothetical protein